MKFGLKILFSILVIGSLPTLVLAASSTYFASTAIYFNTPTDATFSIAMPSSYANTSITGTSQGAATATNLISFNFSSSPQATLQQPYTLGASSSAQNGVTTPIMEIFNTGNTNISLSIYLGSALPANTALYFNGTCATPATTCTTPVTALTAVTTSSQNIVASVYTGQYYNLTLWSNTSTGVLAGNPTRTIYINSTAVA